MLRNEPVQLYTLLYELSSLVDNKDELGSIIGYVVLNTLIGFNSQAGSWQEIQIEQIADVYQGLEDALGECHKTDSFQTLCAFSVKVHAFFKQFNEDSENKEITNSPLLKHIMSKIEKKRGVPEDTLRRNGLALYSDIIERGPLTRKIDCLTQDYRMLEKIFTT